MNNILINGNNKFKRGASYYYLKMLNIDTNIINIIKLNDKDMEDIKKSQNILLSFPLYIDTLPSTLIAFLNKLEEENINNKNIYIIINCGFYEAIQTKVAVLNIKNFCARTNNNFKGFLSIGCGPIGYVKYPLINNKIKKELKKLRESFLNSNIYIDKYISPTFPRFLYIRCANYLFGKQIKKNLLKF